MLMFKCLYTCFTPLFSYVTYYRNNTKAKKHFQKGDEIQ
nr:MAG TPA: hypothetical protein [Caudoviricetes sp.]